MRVIAGKARGHKLIAPRSQKTRPVLDQVKEAIFNILFNVEGARVLDLFAGSGAVGIEALSRGAKSCTFVEYDEAAIHSIKRNLLHCKLESSATILPLPVARALKKLERRAEIFDLIFVDPPYEKDLVNATLSLLGKGTLIGKETRIVVEHHPKEPIIPQPELTLTDQRQYGQTRVSFLTVPQ